MINGREALRDCTNGSRRVDQLEMEKLKLSEGMDYLRQRIKCSEAENHRLLDELLQLKNQQGQLQKERQQLDGELATERQQRKKLEQMLGGRNQNNSNLQKKLSQLSQENTELKDKLAVMADKQNNLLAKRNNHFNCTAKEKQLKDRLATTERELMALNEKYEENRVKLQGLQIRQEATTVQNRRLKKLLEDKEMAFLELREKCEKLEANLQRDECDRKQMLDSLFQMINSKQSELQQKQDEVDKCSHMLKDMSEELEHLLEENKRLDQLNSRFAPIDPTTKIRFGQLKHLSEKVSDRSISQQLLSRLLRVEEQYGQLEQLYDKMLVKYYQSVSASSRQ